MIKTIIRLELTDDICKSAGYSVDKEKFKKEFFNMVRNVLPELSYYLNGRKSPYFRLLYIGNIRDVDLVVYCNDIDFDYDIKNNDYLLKKCSPIKTEEHKFKFYVLQNYLLYFRQLGFDIEEKNLSLIREKI